MSARAPSLDDFAVDLLDDEPSLGDFAMASAFPTANPGGPAPAAPPVTALALVPAIPFEIAAAPAITYALRPDVTGSKAPLAESGCRTWMAPGVVWNASDSSAATAGRINHAFLASLVPGSAAALAPPAMPEDEASRAMIADGRAWLEEKGLLRRVGAHSTIDAPGSLAALPGLRAEVAFALDLETGRGRELVDPPGWDTRWYADAEKRAAYDGAHERGGPVRDSELCMRLDLACAGLDEHGAFARIWDYKFHFKPGWLDARAQLEVAARAVSDAWGVDRVQATGVHLWADREVGEELVGVEGPDGKLLPGPAGVPELDREALEKILAKVRGWARLPANDQAPVPGPHCVDRFCPAIASCSVVTDEIVPQLLPPETLVRRPLAGPLEDNDHAVWAQTAAALFRSLAKQLEDKADAFADAHGGLTDPKRGIYRGEPSESESADLAKPGAIEALEALGLAGAVKRVATWKDLGKGPGGAAKAKAARAALREIGALAITQGTRYEWRTAKMGGQS